MKQVILTPTCATYATGPAALLYIALQECLQLVTSSSSDEMLTCMNGCYIA